MKRKLRVLAFNCTLKKKNPEKTSSTQRLLQECLRAFAEQDADGEIVHVADYRIEPGVTNDEGDGDQWPELRKKVDAADILLLGTPIWLGQPSSLAKRVMERMDIFLEEKEIIPEELVPVQRVGKLTLNRNPDNFFAETEQVAFHPGHIVPGIDFSNDPLLQGRLFSYLDTQLTRLGGPNFTEIPINRPIAPVHNNQRDGFMRQTINKGRTAHEPNRIAGGCPFQAMWKQGGFVSYTQPIEGHKVRARSASFTDHFSQAALFFNSLSIPEKNHLIDALRFELGKVEIEDVRQRMLAMLAQVDGGLAGAVGEALTLEVPDEVPRPLNLSVPADAEAGAHEPKPIPFSPIKSPALSQANQPCSPKTRRIAVMVADGFYSNDVAALTKAALAEGAMVDLVSTRVGMIKDAGGKLFEVPFSVYTVDSVLFDAVYIADGAKSAENLTLHMNAVRFLQNAYVHCKPIGVSGAGRELFKLGCPRVNGKGEPGIVIGLKLADDFLGLMSRHRYWERENTLKPGFEQKPEV